MENSHTATPALIFDFGGVLLDWDPRYLYRRFFKEDQEAMERFLAETGFLEWNLRQDEGRPFAEAVADHCARFPQHCEMIRAYDLYWEESISGPILPTVNILADLKQAGYPLYGLSNFSREKFELIRRRYEFFSCFDDILLSGEAGLLKPDPRIFDLLLERIRRRPQDCLLIDDSAGNIAAADALGFRTIHFSSPEKLRADLFRIGILPTGYSINQS